MAIGDKTGGPNRRSIFGAQKGPKKSKIGCSGGCPGATKVGQKVKVPKFGESAKTKLLCEMSIQSRLFLDCLKKQNRQNVCFHLGPVLCACDFQPSKCVLRGGKSGRFEHFGDLREVAGCAGKVWVLPAKLCVGQKSVVEKSTGAAQHS